MFEDYLISMGVAVLLAAIKNPTKKASMKRIYLKVFRAIKLAFADDPDFE